MIRFRLAFLLPLLLLLWLLPAAAPAAALPLQQSNLLGNASFEEPYDAGTATGWFPWHEEFGPKPENCLGNYAQRPNWAQERSPVLVRDGASSQSVGNNWDTWHGGVAQTVDVTAGSTYRFSFWAIGRAANEEFPEPSHDWVDMGVRAGIDPDGSGLWQDEDVVWGPAGSPHDSGNQANWQQFTVEATATANQVTVFTQANFVGPEQCRQFMVVWFDQAQLVEAAPPPTNTPLPPATLPPATSTPAPGTASSTPEATPSNTPLPPTATPTRTPPPPETGTICVNAFADLNSNGQREETEGAMAGVTFTVAQGESIVAQGVSTGPSAICFDALDPGTYQVAQEVPNTLEMTTGASAELNLSAGQTIRVEFGSRARPQQVVSSDDVPGADTVTPDPEVVITADDAPSTGADDGNPRLLAISGLVALFLGVVLLGGLIYMMLRPRP